LIAGLLVGCDAQAGSDYSGQPLVTLHGTVNNQSGQPPSYQIDAALLWLERSATPDAIMSATPVQIEKVFPAQFTITIYLPPPTSVLQSTTLPYAAANLGAISHGASPADIASGAALFGRLSDPLLYYFRTDVPAGSLERQYGALKQGYHLLTRTQTVDPNALPSAQIDACAATLTGERHEIAFADAQLECKESLLSHTSHQLPLDTPLLLQVSNP
jgi:hypothetical protein